MAYKIKKSKMKEPKRSYGKTIYDIEELDNGKFRVKKNNRIIEKFATFEEAKAYAHSDVAINNLIVSSPYISRKKKMEMVR